ncbi:DUF4082 domain-containing protein [Agromyces intestinalis]|uniref:DUF4082 domain-containing protein n=1 Tax=Agromyces intestinalis TaxID=2592652 RepID=UPI001AEFE0B5|nr:DUF4082 domain-containing protein [Agromyces intestinalis]
MTATAAPAAAVGFLDERTQPRTTVVGKSGPVELGVRFSVARAGTVVGIEFYRPRGATGQQVGTLWGPEGERLASVRFPKDGSTGWVSADFDTPVDVEPGKTYIASYIAPKGKYVVDARAFTRWTKHGHIILPKGAGVYRDGKGHGKYSKFKQRSANYFVDVRFIPRRSDRPTATSAPPPTPTTAPVPTSVPTPTSAPNPTPPTTPTPAPPQQTAPPVTSPPSASPTATPVPTAPNPRATLDLPLEPWYGGPSYYAKFPKAAASGWTDPSFFPIAVFFGKPGHASALAAIGVNTYMGAEHDGSTMSSITRHGISVIAQPEWTPAEVGSNARVVGWHISDECEMGLGGCDGEEFDRLATQRRYADESRSLGDGRFLQANFGNGVLGTWWAPTTMDDHLGLIDLSSVDKYAYTSPHVQDLLRSTPSWPRGMNPASASAYGWQQDRMESFTSPSGAKPNWVFVETAKPYLTENGATTITGDQIEGAVWNSIIHGASGIAYFQHNNDGKCGNYSLVQCSTALKNTVRDINAQVRSLAPVINTQSYVWNFGPGLETALKVHGGYAYIFAMTDASTGSRTFTLPAGISAASVEVVDEARRIQVTGGKFTDTFAAEHTHHVYRIALD